MLISIRQSLWKSVHKETILTMKWKLNRLKQKKLTLVTILEKERWNRIARLLQTFMAEKQKLQSSLNKSTLRRESEPINRCTNLRKIMFNRPTTTATLSRITNQAKKGSFRDRNQVVLWMKLSAQRKSKL